MSCSFSLSPAKAGKSLIHIFSTKSSSWPIHNKVTVDFKIFKNTRLNITKDTRATILYAYPWKSK
jgi:hypothetical protein